MKKYWIAALVFGCVFIVLFAVRTGVMFDLFCRGRTVQAALTAEHSLPERDTWMNILQNGEKIGYAHTVFSRKEGGYALKESVFMQLNAMDLVHRIKMETTADLTAALAIDTFQVQITSGRFNFAATGKVREGEVTVETQTGGDTRQFSIPVQEPPYLASGVLYAICDTVLTPGETMTFSVFDPSVMASVPVRVTLVGKEQIKVMGTLEDVTKVSLDFKGTEQLAWISENCEIMKEAGILGLTLIKTWPHEAISGISEKAGDITDMAAIPSNVQFDNPEQLDMLKLEVSGVDIDPALFATERQTLDGNVLTIRKERLDEMANGRNTSRLTLEQYLAANAFIQADDPAIIKTARRIVADKGTAVEKAVALVDWVYENIEKRAVASLPNALETLNNREGDCNEHAVLLAAIARAVGLPARVETGVVYLDGRFYYHAWNTLYLGRWVTADASFGQMPADVTHIRMAGGSGDAQFDLMRLIGRIQLKVMDYTFADGSG